MLPLGDGLSGRYIMVDDALLERLCEYADVRKGDTILEIGAGTGNLTEVLLEHGANVVAIEKDPRYFNYLEKSFKGEVGLTVIRGDAVKIDLPAASKVVSNIPYAISKKLILKLIRIDYEKIVIVCQREFAKKLNANAGENNYRFISAITQTVCKVKVREEVPPSAFNPKPKVWSAVVELTPKSHFNEKYAKTLQKLFNHKNKNIRNILEDAPKAYSEGKPCDLSPQQLMNLIKKVN